MENLKNKPGAGISFLGFLVTFILTLVLLLNGILLGLKTTIFKGSDMVDVLKNANLFETVTEVVTTEISNATGQDALGDMAGELLTEDLMAEVAQNVTDAVVKKEEVDLSGMKDTYVESIKNTSGTMVDNVIDEITNNGTEINLETLANNPYVQSLQASYGVDISSMVMGYVEETYGSTSISLDQVDMEAVKQKAQTAVEEIVVPMAEATVDAYIEKVNTVVNEEIRTISKQIDISGILATIETVIGLLNKIVIALCVAIVILIVVEFLLYKSFINRAFKNVGTAAIWSGIPVVLLGGGTILGKNFVMNMFGGGEDKITQVITNFVETNVSVMGQRILLIGGIYVAVALVCFIIASITGNKARNINETA